MYFLGKHWINKAWYSFILFFIIFECGREDEWSKFSFNNNCVLILTKINATPAPIFCCSPLFQLLISASDSSKLRVSSSYCFLKYLFDSLNIETVVDYHVWICMKLSVWNFWSHVLLLHAFVFDLFIYSFTPNHYLLFTWYSCILLQNFSCNRYKLSSLITIMPPSVIPTIYNCSLTVYPYWQFSMHFKMQNHEEKKKIAS